MKMEPNHPTTVLMSEQVKRLKDIHMIGKVANLSEQAKQSKLVQT